MHKNKFSFYDFFNKNHVISEGEIVINNPQSVIIHHAKDGETEEPYIEDDAEQTGEEDINNIPQDVVGEPQESQIDEEIPYTEEDFDSESAEEQNIDVPQPQPVVQPSQNIEEPYIEDDAEQQNMVDNQIPQAVAPPVQQAAPQMPVQMPQTQPVQNIQPPAAPVEQMPQQQIPTGPVEEPYIEDVPQDIPQNTIEPQMNQNQIQGNPGIPQELLMQYAQRYTPQMNVAPEMSGEEPYIEDEPAITPELQNLYNANSQNFNNFNPQNIAQVPPQDNNIQNPMATAMNAPVGQELPSANIPSQMPSQLQPGAPIPDPTTMGLDGNGVDPSYYEDEDGDGIPDDAPIGNTTAISPPIPTSHLSKLDDIKFILESLLALRDFLNNESDLKYEKLNKKIVSALELLITVIGNLDSFATQVDDLIMKYKRFLHIMVVEVEKQKNRDNNE